MWGLRAQRRNEAQPLPTLPLEKNQIVLVGEQFYKVVADYREATGQMKDAIHFELVNVNNEQDYFGVTEAEAQLKLGKSWKIVELNHE